MSDPSAAARPNEPRVIHGNCIEVMASMPQRTADFILTDPPYIARYRDRQGRTVLNDDGPHWLWPAYAQMHRVLKRNSLCVSFYGWNKVDLFTAAWKAAGFTPVAHLIFRKRYASRTRFVRYRHEAAYLLAKGRPAFPKHPPNDVLDWKYTGNRLHPTQKPIGILQPLIEAFTQPGQLVLDPFAGSGSTLVAAIKASRQAIGIELDVNHHRTAQQRLFDNARRTA